MKKQSMNQFDQPDLWSSAPPVDAAPREDMPAEAPVAPAGNAPAPACMPSRPATVSRRIIAARPSSERSEAAKPSRTIARFLTLNHAIIGVGDLTPARLEHRPERVLAKVFRLWKDHPSSSAGFNTICF